MRFANSVPDRTSWSMNQDHYAVLGLKKLRYRASENQIKKAYKNKVLKHHPDKRRARGVVVKGEGEDDYFTCITRAYEVLGPRTKRRSYDSVDPEFDDSTPSLNQQTKDNFFSSFGPVFERNARWSNKKRKVPMLGGENDTIDNVNNFYSFWYDFDSWREYSYLDEEEKEKGENREERRWIEKQNKVARLKKKKEESARIRLLVDNAYACDPRIQRFRDEEKEKKLAQKRAKQEAARQKAEEEVRIKQEALEEERKKKEKEEEEAKAQAAAAKKEKEAQKKIFKKERKALRTCAKDMDYFATSEQDRVSNMADVDRLADLLSLTKLQSLNEELGSRDQDKARAAFYKEVDELNQKCEEEKKAQLETIHRQASGENTNSRIKEWKEEEVQFLIKAVNLFPAGTKERWEVIASFIKQHVTTSNKTAKDVLGKAKNLQKNDAFLKQDADRKAFEKFEQQTAKPSAHNAKPKEGVTSERFESVGEQQIRETGTNPAPWTAEEQKLLEQSLKTFPASTPERWEKIAAVLPARSKKDCMKRYKELVELIRAKKAATEAAAKKK
ncbi:DnaJ-like subfamily C member 2 [Mizuhopecten yessoensis]|uniref:DnaJ-like subfamily C member 2 n=1 Tax=Mizuhopecten yessoensis TaxID=6573 RepID=A0A210Q4E2_MIZYE|nr:DnaJ-like subfamily C member 2 [Mizuhopecten yessoensis]